MVLIFNIYRVYIKYLNFIVIQNIGQKSLQKAKVLRQKVSMPDMRVSEANSLTFHALKLFADVFISENSKNYMY